MNNKLFSIGEAIKTGWRLTIANFWSFLVILLVTWGVSALTGGFRGREGGHPGMLSFVISVLGWVVGILLQMGLLRVTLKVLDGGKAAVSDFYSEPMHFLKFFAANILYGIGVGIGLILLVVPGIIFALRCAFSSYLVVDKGMGPIEALKRSWEMTRGHMKEILVFALAILGINLAGALIFGIGLLWTVPLTTIAGAFVYRKFLAAPSVAAPSADVHAAV